MIMETSVMGSVLLDIFELEAVAGLSLLAIVIVVLVRALFDERHRDGVGPHHGTYR